MKSIIDTEGHSEIKRLEQQYLRDTKYSNLCDDDICKLCESRITNMLGFCYCKYANKRRSEQPSEQPSKLFKK